MSRSHEDGPSRQSLERAGIASGRSALFWIVGGVAGGAAGLVVVVVVSQGGACGGEAFGGAAVVDAGVDAWRGSRPIEIGMPIIIGRDVRVVPVHESDYEGVAVPRPRRASTTEPARTQAEAPSTAAAASTPSTSGDPPASAASETNEPVATRTFAADDSPVAQAAAVAFQSAARDTVQREYLGQVAACFEQAAGSGAGGAGSITIGFMPADDGRVMGSRVIRDTTGADVGACVAAAARSWRLPAPPRNALELQMSFGR